MTVIMEKKKTRHVLNVNNQVGPPTRCRPSVVVVKSTHLPPAGPRTATSTFSKPTPQPPVCLILALGLAALCTHLALCDREPTIKQQYHGMQTHNQHHQQRAVLPVPKRRPDSSSSFLAEVEDLSDSSIRTRLGRITIEHLGDSPNDFDRLIERIVPEEALKTRNIVQVDQHNNHLQAPFHAPAADANNKTSMRFFRNDKTFASIVYTNAIQDNQRQPRRLINCHLVDLEKHSSDVVIYEAKYDIRTIDVEFREMMQLIEACTNIARLRRRPAGSLRVAAAANSSATKSGASGQQQVVTGSQIFAPPAGPENGLASASSNNRGGGENTPKVVVGRPLIHLTPSAISGGGSGSNQAPASGSLTQFNQIMSGALDRELKQLGPTVDDSNRLDLPPSSSSSGVTFTEIHNHPTENQRGEHNGGGGSGPTPSKRQHYHRKRRQHDHSGRRLQRREHAHAPDRRRRFEPMQPLIPLEHEHEHSRAFNTTGGGGGGEGPLESLDRLVSSIEKYQIALKNFKRQLASHPLVKTINRVSEASKKLVLGEVTAPPDNGTKYGRNSPNGGSTRASVREAIQEISSYDTSDLLSIWRGILPGTNWCGMGDRATSYNDLGFESDIDICCRAHDFCPIRLSAFSSGYGLFNWSFYTRSHCWCDQNFLDCLQQAESPLSNVVMKFYFTIMKTTCLNDNETSNALLSEHNSDSSLKHNLSGGGSQRHKSSSRGATGGGGGGLLKVIEQQAATLLGATDTPHNQNTQSTPPVPHLGIPALKHSQAYQNRYDRQQQQQHRQ